MAVRKPRNKAAKTTGLNRAIEDALSIEKPKVSVHEGTMTVKPMTTAEGALGITTKYDPEVANIDKEFAHDFDGEELPLENDSDSELREDIHAAQQEEEMLNNIQDDPARKLRELEARFQTDRLHAHIHENSFPGSFGATPANGTHPFLQHGSYMPKDDEDYNESPSVIKNLCKDLYQSRAEVGRLKEELEQERKQTSEYSARVCQLETELAEARKQLTSEDPSGEHLRITKMSCDIANLRSSLSLMKGRLDQQSEWMTYLQGQFTAAFPYAKPPVWRCWYGNNQPYQFNNPTVQNTFFGE